MAQVKSAFSDQRRKKFLYCRYASVISVSIQILAEQNTRMQDLFAFLKRLRLAEGEFAIFGSGPLVIRGIVELTNDLDVICRGSAWQDVRKIGSLQFNDDYGVEIITLFGGRMTFGNKWGIGDFDVDELIDNADFFDGLPFVKLKRVIEYKLIRKSEKDLRHLESFRQSRFFAPLDEMD